MNKLLLSFVIGSAVAMVGSPLSALAEQIPMDNPAWGYVLSGLGSKGLDTAYVFTNTTATMSWTAPDGVQSVELLVVGGGGAGGAGVDPGWGNGGGGGGGAGGCRHIESQSVQPGLGYSIKVGAGAAAATQSASADTTGRDSKFGDVVAHGGGSGGSGSDGYAGGSGGGGGSGRYINKSFKAYVAGKTEYPAEGNDGGNAAAYGGSSGGYGTGGGGGGASQAGNPAGKRGDHVDVDFGGEGGEGVVCGITGVDIVYSSGGGGGSVDGCDSPAVGGTGAGTGGGKGATNGGDATGYGCGGGGGSTLGDMGGKGFQGIVVVRVNVREKVVVSMDDPTWGYKILGLDSTGHETVYVFTNTAAQMTWTAPVGTTTAELLVVGGGGAGGDNSTPYSIGGGGGGAGGYVYNKAYAVTANQAYAISVGAGAKTATEKVGGDSTFGGIIAKGGGCGGTQAAGQNGGSGGGGSGKKNSSTTYAGGTGSAGQGFAGGAGEGWWKGDHVDAGTGGGGGGAGAKGGNAPSDEQGGIGGAGKTCSITGEDVVYCSGGGGGTDGNDRTYNESLGCYNGIGGVGAGNGGDGSNKTGGDATGYGCGGGGATGNRNDHSNLGGKGFQGVVIVRVYEHEWDWNDIVFSTCTEAGHSNAVCTIEGCAATAHLDIAPLGHDFSGLPGDHVCAREGCNVSAAVFPTLDSVVYTGAPQKPDLTDEYFEADYGAETYTDAKTYTIKLTPKANTVWSDTQSAAARNVSYTITQAENEWTTDPSVSPIYWKVTAVPDEITIVNGSAVFGTVVCDKTVEDLKKLAAGTHQVNFTVAETANWAGLTKSVAIEIAAGIALDGTLNANSRTVSLNLGASSKPLALVLAYGATDEGGKLWDGWDSQMVLKKIAGGSGASQYTYKMPLEGLGDGVKYIRFFLVADQEPIDNAEIEGMSATFDFIPHVHNWSSYVDADGVRRYSCSDPDCTEKKEYPLEYSHLWDYLKGDGVGYLKTDYVPDMRKTRIEMVYRHDDIESNLCFFQANKSSVTDKKTDDDGMMLYYWGGNQKYVTFYNFDGATTVDGYVPDTRKHTISAGKKTVTIDGRYVATLTDDTYLTVQGPMVFYRHLFYYGYDGYFKHSIYSVKIYETENNVETLVHDYVPATKDGQNAGFWDRVENKYWPATSAGFKAKTNGLSITIR